MTGRYVPPSDGQPANIEIEADVEAQPLPFERSEFMTIVSPANPIVHCPECSRTKNWHAEWCPYRRAQ